MNRLEKGQIYEKYILSIVKSNYKICKLWSKITLTGIKEIDDKLKLFMNKKNEICDDIGCDIIGINFDNSFEFIQCKDYDPKNSIKVDDLAGFYRFCAEYDFGQPIVYFSGRLSCQITKYTYKIRYINIPSESVFLNKIDIIPRDYQIDAYNKLKDSEIAVLDLPCGMGKTMISYLFTLDYDNTIILTPKIPTCDQIATHYKNYYGNTINIIQINCQNERNNEIKLKKRNVLISTYDSCDIINKLFDKFNTDPLVVIDEFHNLSNNNMFTKTNEIYKLLQKEIYLIYMSATPKYYKGIDYGEIYSYDWKEAIKKKFICSFKFHLPPNDLIASDKTKIKINDKIDIDIKLFNQMYFILEGLKETNSKKCIVYCKSLDLCETYKSYVKIINNNLKYDLKVFEITYETTKKSRKTTLEKFTNDTENINIIFSIHVLDEGIDIACCDSVFITTLNDNPLNLLQRISRCNRIDEDNENKIANIFIWTDNCDKLNKMLDTKFVVAESANNGIATKKPWNCSCCKYKTYCINDLQKHLDTNKHIKLNNKLFIKELMTKNKSGLWECVCCKYTTFDDATFKRHIKIKTHIAQFEKHQHILNEYVALYKSMEIEKIYLSTH